MIRVVLSAPRVADHPNVGGHFWEYMQYAHGLRAVGCDVWWIERVSLGGDPSHGVDESLELRISKFLDIAKAYDLSDRVILYLADPSGLHARLPWKPVTPSLHRAEEVVRTADLLVNFDYAMDPEIVAAFRRTALIDIDPGLLQFWMHYGQLRPAPHDVYFTTGETVGTPDARFPDCGLPWNQIRPSVALDLWPYAANPASETFTTVSSWWGDEWITDGVDHYENNKRVTFLEYWDIPARARARMELALYLGPGDDADVAKLRAGGWRVRQSSEVAGTPHDYRRYVRGSRGEFSCVKPSCIRFQNAWVSDRTLCYLASGKPAVVQDTGPSAVLPSGEGLFRFSTIDEAVAALEEVDAHYDRHCRAARELVEAHFDAADVAGTILDVALNTSRAPAPPAHGPSRASNRREPSGRPVGRAAVDPV